MPKQIRARLSEAEYDVVKRFRGMAAEAEAAGIPPESVNHGWYKCKSWSLHFKQDQASALKQVFSELLSEVKQKAPKLPKPQAVKGESHLLVIDPADIHVGKLCSAFETGDNYNHIMAVQRVMDGVSGILNKAKGFSVDQILLIIGNDALHVDTPRSTTTSGTFQDTSVMWYDAFRLAFKMYRNVGTQLAAIAPVRVQYNPSNHDYQTGFFLAQALEAWFSKAEGMQFDVSPAHRKYMRYHNNLISTTHGDGAKEQDLPLLMAHEAAEAWAACKYKYVYTHHIHHKKSRDYMSVTVEALRSPSGTDSWHHRNGYQHSPKAVEGFIHHKEHGQIARLTNYF